MYRPALAVSGWSVAVAYVVARHAVRWLRWQTTRAVYGE